MFGIGKLMSAIGVLTNNVLDLAASVKQINQGLRGQLQLDHKEEAIPLPSQVLDQVAAPEPARNGRSRKTASAE